MADNHERIVVDQYDNRFRVKDEEIARGGQGAVFQTEEGDLAVKQPITPKGDIDRSPLAAHRVEEWISLLRSLPIPEDLHIAAPLSALKSEPGYVMKLLQNMRSFEYFNALSTPGEAEEWFNNHPDVPRGNDEYIQRRLVRFIESGSYKARYKVLYKCACELARLHAAGIVYGDLAPGNLFMAPDGEEVWLIDPDNLRLESRAGAKYVYTPRYGAPEVVQLKSGATAASDIWAFAVMAFESLYLHPKSRAGWLYNQPVRYFLSVSNR